MIRDEAIEQADAPTGTPAFIDVGLWRTERGAGNVEMHPRSLVNKPLYKLCRRNGTAPPPAGIFHVGKFRIDHLVVFWPERHAPYPFAGRLSRLDQSFGEFVVIGEHPGVFLAERHNDGAGQ